MHAYVSLLNIKIDKIDKFDKCYEPTISPSTISRTNIFFIRNANNNDFHR